MRRALGIAVPLVALAVGAVVVASTRSPTIRVPAGDSTQRALDLAPAGTTVRLGAGDHTGPLLVDKELAIVGDEGARVVAPEEADAALHVTAPGVYLGDLTVVGGWTGIDVDDAAGTVVQGVRVLGSEAQGIRVYKAEALIDGVTVASLRDPHAQGIEVLSAPDVVVRDSSVTGGKVGLVAHLSDSLFEDNHVSGTSLVAIMIREMGMGAARDNTITHASGAGLYCGDMSRCAFENNHVGTVEATSGGRSAAGWGLVVNYRATASNEDNSLAGAAGESIALSHSRIVPDSPLELGIGAEALWPALLSTLVGLVALALVYLLSRRLLRAGWARSARSSLATLGITLLVAGVAIQSFHMLEHVVQLYRVYADGLPSRGALVGSIADTEWVHFAYNAAVLAGLGAMLVLRRRGWTAGGRDLLGDRLVLAAGLLQGYHLVEHSAKVIQHVTTGAKVNPGLVGNEVNLVLLHFGLNAAIYLAFMGAAVAYLGSWRPSLLVRLPDEGDTLPT